MKFASEADVIDAIAGNYTIGCGHVDPLLRIDTLETAVKKCMKALKPHKDEFAAIAMSGYSSTIIGSVVAAKMRKNICIVRKEDENCHSNYLVEGKPGQTYVFIDDLIASGRTLRRVYESMKQMRSKLYGVYLYLDTVAEYYLEQNTEKGVKPLNKA